MTWYDDYRNRISIYGDNEQEIVENIWTENFEIFFERAGNKKEFNINDSGVLEFAVIKDNSNSEDMYDKKILLAKKNSTFSNGTYFNWENYYWLLTAQDIRVIDSHKKFFFGKCNSLLNGIDSNGNIYSYPCIRKLASSTEIDTKEDKNMTLTAGDLVVRVQDNEITRNLARDTRFIFSKYESYKMENIYEGLEDGIILLKMEQYEMNPDTDKLIDYNGKQIWIADYENREVYTLDIQTSNSELAIGENITIEYTITNSKGDIVELPVTFSSSDENITTIDENGVVTAISNGNSVITVRMTDNTSVSDTVNVNVVAMPVDNIVYTFEPDMIKFRRTEDATISVVKLNNGDVVAESYSFSVDSSNEIPSRKYEFEVIDGDSFKITNHGYNGTFAVRIVPDSDVSNEFVKTWKFTNGYS